MRKSTLLVGLTLIATSTLSSWAANPPISSQPTVSPHPHVHQINVRLRKQWMLISEGLRSGKLTKDQAMSLKADLKSIRQQEVTFFKQNGNHELTADQQSKLNTLLDKNSQILGENSTSPRN